MKIGFKKSLDFPEYRNVHGGHRVCFLDGQEKDLPESTVQELLGSFPDNFYLVKEISEPPEDKMIRKQEIRPRKKRKSPKFKKIE